MAAKRPPISERMKIRESLGRSGSPSNSRLASRILEDATPKGRQALKDAVGSIGSTKPAVRQRAIEAAEEVSKRRGALAASTQAPPLGKLRILGRAAARGLLSPAGLSEEVAARAARDVSAKRFKDEAKKERNQRGPVKRPITRS